MNGRGITRLDHLPATDAVIAAWSQPCDGPVGEAEWHRLITDKVRAQMPVLARALDRLARESARSKGVNQ